MAQSYVSSIPPSIHLSILLPSIYPPSIPLFFPASNYPSIHPSLHPCLHPSILLSIYPSLHPSIYLSFHPSLLPSIPPLPQSISALSPGGFPPALEHGKGQDPGFQETQRGLLLLQGLHSLPSTGSFLLSQGSLRASLAPCTALPWCWSVPPAPPWLPLLSLLLL